VRGETGDQTGQESRSVRWLAVVILDSPGGSM